MTAKTEIVVPAGVLKIPAIPDITTHILWHDVLQITVRETALMARADMLPLKRAEFDFTMLHSLTEGDGSTNIKLSSPEPPFTFAPPRGTEYAGRGTTNREEATQLVLLHMAALTFNNARARFKLTDAKFAQQTMHALRLMDAAKMYYPYDPHDPVNTPPIGYIHANVIFKIIVEIAMVRVNSVPSADTDCGRLTRVIQRLGAIHTLLNEAGQPRGFSVWITWLGEVKKWQVKTTAVFLAAYVAQTKTIPGVAAMNEAISQGAAPALPYAEIEHLLRTTKNLDSPFYRMALEKRDRLVGMSTAYYKHDTTALYQSIMSGDLFCAEAFAPVGLPTADTMDRLDTSTPMATQRTTLVAKLMPRAVRRLRFIDPTTAEE